MVLLHFHRFIAVGWTGQKESLQCADGETADEGGGGK